MKKKIKCPCCMRKYESLEFWTKINNIYFHICKDCCKKRPTTEQLLMIGHSTGFIDCLVKVNKSIQETINEPY